MLKLFNIPLNFDYNCYQDNRFYTYNPLADLMLFMRDSDAPLKVVPSIFVNDEALKFESGILYSSPDTISRLHRSRNNHTSYAKLVRCIINENIFDYIQLCKELLCNVPSNSSLLQYLRPEIAPTI